MNKDEMIEELVRRSLALTELNLEEYYKVEKLGLELGLVELREELEHVARIARQVPLLPLGTLSASALSRLRGNFNALDDVLNEIDKYDGSQGSQQKYQTLNSVRQRLPDIESGFSKDLLPAQVAALNSGELAATQQAEYEMRVAALKTLEEQVKTALARVSGLEQQQAQSIGALAKAAPQAAIATHAQKFHDAAKWHNYASVAALVAVVGLALWLFNTVSGSVPPKIPAGTPGPTAFALVLGHYTEHALQILALVVALKVFAAERHNALVNKHRATALQTFEAFSAGASSEEVRQAVLLQATASVFTHQATGYLKGPIELQNMPVSFLGGNSKNPD